MAKIERAELHKSEITQTKLIPKITADDLRRMVNNEGLILQGCGGDLQDWVDGINKMLTEVGILKNGDQFKDVSAFEYNGTTNMLFKMDGVNLETGKLAMWRLQTHSQFWGTWLCDYVPNRLGGFTHEDNHITNKPDCDLIGQDGNVFNLVGIASPTLKQHGLSEQAKEMTEKVFACGSYSEALNIIGDYVNITGHGDFEEDCNEDLEMGGIYR